MLSFSRVLAYPLETGMGKFIQCEVEKQTKSKIIIKRKTMKRVGKKKCFFCALELNIINANLISVIF